MIKWELFETEKEGAEAKMSIYIVRAKENGKTYDYEYGCLDHAIEQYNNEKSAELIEYKKGNYHLMQCK